LSLINKVNQHEAQLAGRWVIDCRLTDKQSQCVTSQQVNSAWPSVCG